MRSLSLLSQVSALLFVSTGLVIAGNDVFVGIKSSVPAVSIIVSLLFLLAGVFLFFLGKSGVDLLSCIEVNGTARYRRHLMLLSILFSMTTIFGTAILYGVISRIEQGFSIFG
ncbi:hypothetical protein LL364_001521 [Citrobacter freundii]|nr:hypothetical protein [Citrobacter freundii]MBJ4957708.1 hypothetical protein [Salmonella enterica subsp. enterica serovar Goldcoast]